MPVDEMSLFTITGMDILNAIIATLGLLLHWFLKWSEYREEVSKIGFIAYFNEVPAKTAIAILSSFVAFLVCWALEWMNPALALACGYMGNSIVDNLTKNANSRIIPPS